MLETLTPAGTYAFYLALVIVGFIFVLFCYPESSESLGNRSDKRGLHDRGSINRRDTSHLRGRVRYTQSRKNAAREAGIAEAMEIQ